MKAVLYFDGSNNKDLTRASGGFVLELSNGTEVKAQKRTDPSKFPPESKMTNNIGEYTALGIGLREVLLQGVSNVEIIGDSELIIKQMLGQYRVKDVNLKTLNKYCHSLLVRIPSWSMRHVPRDFNKADKYSRVEDEHYNIRYL